MSRSPEGYTKGRALKRSSIGQRKNTHRIKADFRLPAMPCPGSSELELQPRRSQGAATRACARPPARV